MACTTCASWAVVVTRDSRGKGRVERSPTSSGWPLARKESWACCLSSSRVIRVASRAECLARTRPIQGSPRGACDMAEQYDTVGNKYEQFKDTAALPIPERHTFL